jgi:hypothetical protein
MRERKKMDKDKRFRILEVKIEVHKQFIPVLLVAIFSLAGYIGLNYKTMDFALLACVVTAITALAIVLFGLIIAVWDTISDMEREV